MGPEDHPRFVLACDHRRPHLAALLDRAADPGPDDRPTIETVKATIATAFESVAADVPGAGLLIDDEYGAEPARAAIARGREVAMPLEASGLDRFALADPGIVDRVLGFGPRWVKALVRYNVEGDPATNAASVAALRGVTSRLQPDGPGLMLEVIVPPTPNQLSAAGSTDAFVRTRRADLIADAMRELLDAGIAPRLWKVEGVDDPGHATLLADAARAADRPAGILVLGAGAPTVRVDAWLRVAARTPGYAGFAVGRSLWWDDIRGLLARRCDRDAASHAIARNFRHAIDAYSAA